MIYRQRIIIRPTRQIEVVDITPKIQDFIDTYAIQEGRVDVQQRHTTAGLVVNENEEGILYDLESLVKRLVPPKRYYQHDDWDKRKEMQPDERVNGPAHQIAMLLTQPDKTIYVIDGKIELGTYQRVLFIDFDGHECKGHRRERHIDLYCMDPSLRKDDPWEDLSPIDSMTDFGK